MTYSNEFARSQSCPHAPGAAGRSYCSTQLRRQTPQEPAERPRQSAPMHCASGTLVYIQRSVANYAAPLEERTPHARHGRSVVGKDHWYLMLMRGVDEADRHRARKCVQV